MQIRPAITSVASAIKKIIAQHWDAEDPFRQSAVKRLEEFLSAGQDQRASSFRVLVADVVGEVVGVAMYRKAPSHLRMYASTENPVEFYLSAVATKRKKIGTMLRDARIEAAKAAGYTEALVFSAESHRESWAFYDNSRFDRVADTVAPNGEKGVVWHYVFE